MKKRSYLIIVIFILLALIVTSVWHVYNQPKQVVFTMNIDSTVPATYAKNLQDSVLFNSQSKAEALGLKPEQIAIDWDSSPPLLTVDSIEQSQTDAVTMAILDPFSFNIMTQSTLADADIVINQTDAFKKTSITEKDIVWVETAKMDGGEGAVTMYFTPDAQQRLKEIYAENVNTSIGLFVRNRLIAQLLVKSDNFDKDIHILNIPSIDLATLFADDVNTGRYVTFSQ